MEDLHPRVAHLEKEVHTLMFRMEAVDNEKLPHRVTSLESAMVKATDSMARMEKSMEEIKKEVSKQKLWMAAILSAGMGGAELVQFLQRFLG
jgi:hypothetical protein